MCREWVTIGVRVVRQNTIGHQRQYRIFIDCIRIIGSDRRVTDGRYKFIGPDIHVGIAGRSALVNHRRTDGGSRVDCERSNSQRVCFSEATVLLKGVQQRVGIDQVAGL